MFDKILKRSSWTDVVISMIFVVLGLLIIAKPYETLNAISIILGILFGAMGVLKLVEYYYSDDREDYLLCVALIFVIFGVVIGFASEAVMDFFRVILGLWIVATGIMDFQTILMWKEVKSPYWTATLLFSLLIMLAGIMVMINQGIVITTIGIVIVLYGLLDIVDRIIFICKIKD